MLKKVLIPIFIGIFTLLLSSGGVLASEINIIENNQNGIPDEILYKEILKQLGKEPTDKITISEAQNIKQLQIIGERQVIKSLQGIEYLSQLESLQLENLGIKTLDGVERLSKLAKLDVSSNEIKSLKPVENLKDLYYINAGFNDLKNLKGISKLEKLKTLYLEHNKLTSIKEVKGLARLVDLVVSDNDLKNLKGIEKLTNLINLYAGHNKLTGINEVKSLKKLEVLQISSNNITKLPNLKKHKKMDLLYCDVRFNKLTKEEIRRKLPSRFFAKKNDKDKKQLEWVADQITFQNLNHKIKYIEPSNKYSITTKTQKIIGKTFENAYIRLCCTKKGFRSKRVKADTNGHFVLDKLNLKKWSGYEFELQIYRKSKYSNTLMRIYANNRFKVKKA